MLISFYQSGILCQYRRRSLSLDKMEFYGLFPPFGYRNAPVTRPRYFVLFFISNCVCVQCEIVQGKPTELVRI
jgi:hypothetical protein